MATFFFPSLPWYKKLFVSILWWIDCLVEQQKWEINFRQQKNIYTKWAQKGSPRKMCAIKFGRRKIYRNYIPFSIIFMLNIQHNGKITAAFDAVHIFSINIFFSADEKYFPFCLCRLFFEYILHFKFYFLIFCPFRFFTLLLLLVLLPPHVAVIIVAVAKS